jgi:hypothetical protein
MTAFKILAVVVAVPILLTSWFFTASIRGQTAAHIDVALGHYEVQGYGLPGPERDEYALLLQSRYGIRFRTVAGCIVSPSLLAYLNGYNEVVRNRANRKFGRDVFEESYQEALQHYQQTRGQAHELIF